MCAKWCKIVLFLPLIFASCRWQEAKDVIALADSIDQTQHVIWDDTAALGKVIRSLDNPCGRVLMSNTLSKAYYYMGRNLEDSYQQIADAAKCYIEADRLKIDDPLYRGRVNSCMGYICAQNNSDSLAVIFYERSNSAFENSMDEWYYAYSLLNIAKYQTNLRCFSEVDSILRICQLYELDSTYQTNYNEIKGLYFYALEQYDSALVCFNNMIMHSTKCYAYLHTMRVYLNLDDLNAAVPYAQYIIQHTHNPNLLKNAYYCLMLDAKVTNNIELLSQYAHLREDASRLLKQYKSNYDMATHIIESYLLNPNPRRLEWMLFVACIVCIFLGIALAIYRKYTIDDLQVAQNELIDLSIRSKEQDNEYHNHVFLEKYLARVIAKYPTPLNRWNDYRVLRRDLAPYLRDWLRELDKLPLTNREKVFCTFMFVYSHLSVKKVAYYMNMSENSMRVSKTGIVRKLGTTSAELPKFLQKLYIPS